MAEAIAVQSDWKSREPTEDTEIYRTSRLEYLESKLKNFDLGLLIDLETECYDASTSKETYDTEIQKLVNGLKSSISEVIKPNKIQPQTKPVVKPSQQNQIVIIDGIRPKPKPNPIQIPSRNNPTNNNNQVTPNNNNNNSNNNNNIRPNLIPAYKPPTRFCDLNNFRRRG